MNDFILSAFEFTYPQPTYGSDATIRILVNECMTLDNFRGNIAGQEISDILTLKHFNIVLKHYSKKLITLHHVDSDIPSESGRVIDIPLSSITEIFPPVLTVKINIIPSGGLRSHNVELIPSPEETQPSEEVLKSIYILEPSEFYNQHFPHTAKIYGINEDLGVLDSLNEYDEEDFVDPELSGTPVPNYNLYVVEEVFNIWHHKAKAAMISLNAPYEDISIFKPETVNINGHCQWLDKNYVNLYRSRLECDIGSALIFTIKQNGENILHVSIPHTDKLDLVVDHREEYDDYIRIEKCGNNRIKFPLELFFESYMPYRNTMLEIINEGGPFTLDLRKDEEIPHSPSNHGYNSVVIHDNELTIKF